MPKRIFISYCHIEPDRTVARQIAAAIKEHHDVFIDQDIRPGGEWGEDIENALQTADFVVVFLSEVATQSPMVIAEIETAHQRRLKTGQPTLIPVRLGFDRLLRYPLSAYVNRFQHIVWRGTNDTEGLISELLSTVTADTATQGHFQPANSERAHKKSFWLKRTADDTLFRRNRHQMIKRVKHDWIDGVLEQSLFQVARIELGFIEKPEAIEQPIHAVLQRSYDEPRPLPPGIGVSTIFDEQLGQLLILGAPGSGKTTVLLELAEELLKRASKDESHPIPVVFNLASWAVHRRSLAAWIVDELNDSYDVPRRLGRQWVNQEQILPMLDGLDEVRAEHRDVCVQSINAFRREHGFVPLVVSSRVTEYEILTTRLRLPGAVVIQPLTRRQVYEYLGRANDSLVVIRQALEEDPTIVDLFDSPLMLCIAMLSSKGFRQGGVQAISTTVEERRHHLFATYVEAMLQRVNGRTYSRELTIHSLIWLASCLKRHTLTMIALESLNPNWVPIPLAVAPIIIGTALALGLGLLGVLGGRGAEGLMVGLAYGGIFSLAAWRILKTEGVLQPVDAIHFSYAWLRNGVGMAAAFALIATVVVGRGEGVAIGAFVGVFTGLAILLMRGLGEGLVENEIVAYSRPNQRTWLSARSAMRFVLFSGVVFATGIAPLQILFVGKSDNAIYRVLNGLWDGLAIGLFAGLFFGLLGGLWKGGLFFLQHFIVRVFLWYKGLAPLSYVRFLDYAAEHLFLRKVGGRYIFIHRLLLEYFASLENKPQ